MAEPLKAQFGAPVVRRLASEIASVHKQFDSRAFQRDALDGFDELELLDRGRHLGKVLHRHLPDDFGSAIDINPHVRRHVAEHAMDGSAKDRAAEHRAMETHEHQIKSVRQ